MDQWSLPPHRRTGRRYRGWLSRRQSPRPLVSVEPTVRCLRPARGLLIARDVERIGPDQPGTRPKSVNCFPALAEPPRTFAPMISGCIALICRSVTLLLVTSSSNLSASLSSAGVIPVNGIDSNVRARVWPRVALYVVCGISPCGGLCGVTATEATRKHASFDQALANPEDQIDQPADQLEVIVKHWKLRAES